MVDAIVSRVVKQLGMIIEKEIEQEVRLVVGVEKDVEKLFNTFSKIQAVLKDAEERQIKEKSVQLWLQDLKDVAYDIDDVLDKWRTEIELKSKTEGVSTSQTMKVCSDNLFSISCCFNFMRIGLLHDIGHRIKQINERLDGIASEKNKFVFSETNSKNESVVELRRALETSSFIDLNEVFGRTRDRDIIINKLLVSEESIHPQQEVVSTGKVVLPIISIVGMPGLGKTTLAQLVFNDDRVMNRFNKRMWVYVSKSFDKVTVAMNIIREIGGVNIDGHEHISWESVHRQLNNCVVGKHFLLVLDDVWNEDCKLWDPLWFSLKKASPESKIMFTTRNKKVAVMMGSTYVHELKILSNEDCWSLLRHYAFVGREKEEYDKLNEIGKELANKCNGLPLSAKTLGSLLCFKKTRKDWESVLVSDLWSVVSSSSDHNSVLPALLLSYYDLPSHLMQCFAYSSIGPKGFTFTKQQMIRKWMAQGFLSDNLAASSEDLVAIGDEYFDNLVMRSLFQKGVKNAELKNEFLLYGMHDLVNDFAKSLVEKECFTLAVKECATKAHQEFNFNRARHLYLATEEEKEIPSFIYKAKNLRSLIIFGHIPSVSSELFLRLTCLRTLDLGRTYIEELPMEIEKLIHLRFLNLSYARIKELPKTVFNLYNLQVLMLHRCSNLCKLPKGIEKLVNLMQLHVAKSPQLNYLPEIIGRLSRLRRLTDFIIGTGVERGGCKFEELKDLNLLKGSLNIIGLGRVENGNEATMADLKSKQHLLALYLYFDRFTGLSLVDEYTDDQEEENKEKEVVDGKGNTKGGEEEEEEVVDGQANTEGEEEEIVNGEGNTKEEEREVDGREMLSRMEDVLESLQPNPNLEKLSINDYPGVVFPKWMVNHTHFMIFSNLVLLDLRGWRKCKQLPLTLGKLSSLETLVIDEMDKVKFMDAEFFGIDSATKIDIMFPKLKVLQLSNMKNLEKWDVRVLEENGKEFIFMPYLQHLVLLNLPKLRISFPQHLTQATYLRKLMVWNCPKLTWKPSPASSHFQFLHIEELILKEDAGSFSKSLIPNNHHIFLPKLKLLRVRKSPYSSLPQGFGRLTSLEILDIRTCSKIKSIPEEELQHLTALHELTIMRCPALSQRCQKETGEDWQKISHIRNIFIDDQKIK